METVAHWWQNGVIYQIYPKSFQDTTGSGSGDLPGVISRLDYLQTLGVDAIWLTPFYVSPQVDNGYDVADYTAIDPAYGTLADFDQLVAEAKARGIRIVLDMVFNHTSTAHPWFRAACQPDSAYRSFYIWRDRPNNWSAKFGGSAWAWQADRQQYYLHLFTPQQADLNWENPAVRAELKKVAAFWADRGVAGLRLDVVNLISKTQSFPDDQQGDGRRFYTDGPRVHEFLQEMSRDLFTPRNLMTVGEMSSTSLAHCQRYAALDGRELSMTFNFHHLKVDYPNGEKWTQAQPDYVALKALFSHWQRGMHSVAWNALFWCNHDQPRIVSRFGDEGEYRVPSAKMLAMVLHGMQGTPYIYQGEEIGMTNPHFRQLSEYRDVESLNMFRHRQAQGQDAETLLAILACRSRDNGRTPMQWSAAVHAGFSSATPWIGLCDNADEINVEAALGDRDSVFYTYQALIALRKRLPLLCWGDYQDLLPASRVLWCYRRRWQGQTLLVVANLSRERQRWTPSEPGGDGWQCLLRNYPDSAEQPQAMYLRPYEAVWWLQH